MSFEHDVFISYAHIDNQPFTPEQKGWVTIFHNVLRTMLSQQLGKTANIWKDERIRGNEDFSTEISDQFPNTATLISVLTPRYLKSDWCTKEIRIFCEVAETTGGLFIKNRGRVFKVIKTPVERVDTDRALPADVIRKSLGYEFFRQEEDQPPTELDPAFGEAYREQFFLRVNRVARDIAELLRQFEGAVEQKAQARYEVAKPKIYLAQCGISRKNDWEKILGDLKSHGYVVLPEQDLPGDEAGYVAEVERLLLQCQLSIHLVGSSYGAIPESDSQKSSVVLQNEVAVKISRTGSLTRVISLPEGTSSTNPTQRAFIDAMLTDSKLQFGADLITGDLQALLGAIHAALKKLEQQKSQTPAKTNEPSGRKIHIIYHEADGKEVIPLMKALKAKGYETSRPIFTGEDSGKIREVNQSLYMECDAVILFYGAGDPTWKYYQKTELKKMRGLRGNRPLLAEFTYLHPPLTSDKELLASLAEEDFIDASNDLSVEAMLPFVKAVGSSGGAK